jgi:hypothetical protein
MLKSKQKHELSSRSSFLLTSETGTKKIKAQKASRNQACQGATFIVAHAKALSLVQAFICLDDEAESQQSSGSDMTRRAN